MFSEKVWHGVESLLDQYVRVRPGDTAAVLYTRDSYEPAAWISAGLELRAIDTRRVLMAPLADPGFSRRLAQALQSAPIPGRLVVLSFERDTMSHTNELHQALAAFSPERRVVLRMISASAEVFADALAASPQELSARNAAILAKCMPARRLRLTTEGGSELAVRIDPRHRWISNRGSARPGGTIVLPAGEVATYPADISGTFVADFAFNINTIIDRDARLDRSPVTVCIERGKAVSATCADRSLQQFLDGCFEMAHARNVGELGFGTNTGVRVPVAQNSHMNERCPGIHIGFGQHNQDEALVGYQCQVHLDLIARGGLVWVDDLPEPVDLAHLQPSSDVHPLHARDEDVFAPNSEDPDEQDCCGILRSTGMPACAS